MSDYDFKADRKEKLERRLATARRVAALPVDPLTKEAQSNFGPESNTSPCDASRAALCTTRSCRPIRRGSRLRR